MWVGWGGVPGNNQSGLSGVHHVNDDSGLVPRLSLGPLTKVSGHTEGSLHLHWACRPLCDWSKKDCNLSQVWLSVTENVSSSDARAETCWLLLKELTVYLLQRVDWTLRHSPIFTHTYYIQFISKYEASQGIKDTTEEKNREWQWVFFFKLPRRKWKSSEKGDFLRSQLGD